MPVDRGKTQLGKAKARRLLRALVLAGALYMPAAAVAQEPVPDFNVEPSLDAKQDVRGTVVTARVTIAVNGVGLICGNCEDPAVAAEAGRLSGRLITTLQRGASCPNDAPVADDPDAIRLFPGPKGEPYRQLPRGLHQLEATFRPGSKRAGEWTLCAWFEYGHDAGVVSQVGPFQATEREAGTGRPQGPTTITIRGRTRGAAAVELSAAQLRINQRISQAAIRRLNVIQAKIDGVPAPEPPSGQGGGAVEVSTAQLRINQRIAQTAVYRANLLQAMLDAALEPVEPPSRSGSGRLALTARQLLINQRISQAAVRRVNALEERIPELPVPRPPFGQSPVRIIVGTPIGAYRFAINQVSRGQEHVGQTVGLVFPSTFPRAFNLGQCLEVSGEGLIANGVFFPSILSVGEVKECTPS